MTIREKIILKIMKINLSEEEKEELKSDMLSINILKELLPFLIHHNLVNVFFSTIKKYKLVEYLDKKSFRLVNRIVTYDTLRDEEYEREFQKIAKSLEKENIKYVILKGFHLKNIIYNNSFNERPYNDIDILIEKKDIIKLKKILEENGYIQGDLDKKNLNIISYDRYQELNYLMLSHQIPQFIKKSIYYDISPNNLLFIDINFSVFEGGKKVNPINTREFLSNRIERKNNYGTTYYSLNYEYDFIQLLYHIYKDINYDSKIKKGEDLVLLRFYDLHNYILKFGSKICWDKFWKTILDANIEYEIYFIIKLLNMLCPNICAQNILRKFKENDDRKCIDAKILELYIKIFEF